MIDNLLAKVKERRLPLLSRGIPYGVLPEDSKTSKENSGSTPSNSSVSSMISMKSKNASACIFCLVLVLLEEAVQFMVDLIFVWKVQCFEVLLWKVK